MHEPEIPVNKLTELTGGCFKKLIHTKLDSIGFTKTITGDNKYDQSYRRNWNIFSWGYKQHSKRYLDHPQGRMQDYLKGGGG